MFDLDALDTLFVVWAFSLQIILIIHFAVRKRYFDTYTLKYGWLVYALCIPAALISIILLKEGKNWAFWLGGFLFLIFSAYGYWVDYIKKLDWRNPLRKDILFPYVTLYLGTIMFYWFPLALLNRPLWYVFAFLFALGTLLNIRSH